MHPNPLFRPEAAVLLAEAERIGVAHVFAATADGPMVVHAPLTLHDGAMRFHVSRANRIVRHLDGAAVVASIAGPHGYVSANWYAVPGDQVPTWNYQTIEIDGMVREIDAAALTEQLDRLAALHEPRAEPWWRGQVAPDAFARQLAGIHGFEIAVGAVRGTSKLSQNKTAADRAGVIAGFERQGRLGIAALMREAAADD